MATIAPNDPNVFLSPYVWDTIPTGTQGATATTIQSIYAGAYGKFQVTNTTAVTLNIDVSTLNVTSRQMILATSVDDAFWTYTSLTTTTTTVAVATGLTLGTHKVQFYLRAIDASQAKWGNATTPTPNNALRINGITVDAGGSLLPYPSIFPKRVMVLGDSSPEGHLCLSSTGAISDDDAYQSWSAYLAQALNAEYGNVVSTGVGLTTVGGGGVPVFSGLYNFQNYGRPRTLTPAPDYLIANMGGNDYLSSVAGSVVQSNTQTMITNLRTYLGPTPWLIIMCPLDGIYESNVTAAFNAYKAATPSDTRTILVDTTPFIEIVPVSTVNQQTTEGAHLRVTWHARFAAVAAALTSKGVAMAVPTISTVLNAVTLAAATPNVTSTTLSAIPTTGVSLICSSTSAVNVFMQSSFDGVLFTTAAIPVGRIAPNVVSLINIPYNGEVKYQFTVTALDPNATPTVTLQLSVH